MMLAGVQLARYRLPLTRRFRGGGVNVEERAGLLVRLEDADGHTGFGEIAPLPGLHAETLEQAESLIEAVAPQLPGLIQDGVPASARAHPSVVFGLEMAAAGLVARSRGEIPASLLGERAREDVHINALFTGTAADAEQGETIHRLGRYPAVKVKIGLHAEEEDRAVLQELHAGLPEQTRLRIDGNRSLTPETLVARLGGLPPERVDYLEEPLADPTQLAALHRATGMYIGLDETLRDAHAQELLDAEWVRAWILKPSMLGFWERIRSLARRGAGRGKSIVISSAIESGLGLWHLAQMAAALPGADTPAGLATEDWLAEDLISPRYDSSSGEVATSAWTGSPVESCQRLSAWRTLC